MNLFIHLILFITSFVFMGIEMLGSRIMTPYFGSSVYTWGSIISVFLIASAAGYLLGGVIADSKKAIRYSNIMYVLSLLLFSFILLLSNVILPQFEGLGERLGTFLAAMFLFFPPTLLLGSIVPVITKIGLMEQLTGKRIGYYHVSSSLGSVAGTLLTTFYFLPAYHLGEIMAIFVLLLGSSFFLFLYHQSIKLLFFSIPLLLLSYVPLFSVIDVADSDPSVESAQTTSRIVEQTASAYHNLTITQQSSYDSHAGDFYLLSFDSKLTQGVINKQDPDALVFPYTQFVASYVKKVGNPNSTLFMIGHGVGSLTKHFEKEKHSIQTIELDEKVLEMSRKHFLYKGNSVLIGDGRIKLKEQPNHSKDMIILDAYGSGTIPYHLATKEFYELAQKKLKKEGLLISNLIGVVPNHQTTNSLVHTLRSVFPNVKVYVQNPDYDGYQTVMVISSNAPVIPPSAKGWHEIMLPVGTVIYDGETKFIDVG